MDFAGAVVPGDQRGRALGYPTINIGLSSPRKLLPPVGVYAVRAQTARGVFGGMMNLGGRPTFGDLDADTRSASVRRRRRLVWRGVSIDFVRRLRDTIKFDGLDALVAQLGEDAKNARFRVDASLSAN